MHCVPVHQLFSLASLRLLICVDSWYGAALHEAFCIFGSVESGLSRLWVDFVTEGMEGNGYLATDIFGELAGLRGFVDCNCSLLVISINRDDEEAANLLRRRH
jgi:hypothetical protein